MYLINLTQNQDGTEEIAKRARAAPGTAIRLLKGIRYVATYQKKIKRQTKNWLIMH